MHFEVMLWFQDDTFQLNFCRNTCLKGHAFPFLMTSGPVHAAAWLLKSFSSSFFSLKLSFIPKHLRGMCGLNKLEDLALGVSHP